MGRLLVLTAAVLLAGCGLGFGRSPVPPPVAPGAEARGLEVTLVWAAPVDLDLYVTNPEQETVYFANRRSASGGALVEDVPCPPAGKEAPTSGEVRETIRWEEPPAGRYRAGIDYIDRCGGEIVEVGYRLVVEAPAIRRETTGTVRLSRFLYQALEFDLPSEDARQEGSR
jgi:hypothetical protein